MNSVAFHPLTYLDEGDEFVVGRRDVDAYVVLPAAGAALLRVLESGVLPAQAAQWYLETYGESVDVDDFVATLAEFDLVRNGYPGGPDLGMGASQEPAAAPDNGEAGSDRSLDLGAYVGRHRHGTGAAPLRWQRLGRAAFSPVAWLAYTVTIVAAIVACVRDPGLVPTHAHVFFTDSLVAIELSLVILQLPFILLHEAFHVLAGRRLGLNSRIQLGNRFYFLVFETVMNGLVSVPRRKRYLPMLAGVLVDTVMIAALTLGAAWLRGPGADRPAADLLGRLCLALAFTTIPRILWQGYFFLRTDGYYLVATATGCNNLHEASWWRIRRLAARWGLLRPERIPAAEDFTAADLRVSRWYAPLMIVGYALATVFMLVVALPLAWRFFATVADNVFGGAQSTALVIDSAIILALNGIQVLAVLFLVVRRRAGRSSRPASSLATASRNSAIPEKESP